MELTIKEVLADRALLKRVLKSYNAQKATAIKYYEKNKEKRIKHSLDYYYKKVGKEPKTENKTADKKQYMKDYREKKKLEKQQQQNNNNDDNNNKTI
jgi:hypothetical protein